ncbi:hypothetical protein TESG_04061 [Trichophyton tonsurans CBS 112818]|uniref:Uncharacterized protein n=1 Tax=Trichophyton tonsurans (strain CBS 112818) TaxID=647933 RepID=F2RZ78_TRIT1|nr:hypothetical protein TESG_04061 [Trichophyton tonsurans CBS 112818]
MFVPHCSGSRDAPWSVHPRSRPAAVLSLSLPWRERTGQAKSTREIVRSQRVICHRNRCVHIEGAQETLGRPTLSRDLDPSTGLASPRD